MKYENLKITSHDNPDWCGCWTRSEVEREMKELDCTGIGAWNWAMDHAFDSFCGDVPDHDRLAQLLEEGVVTDVSLSLKEGSVRIRQS